MNMIKCEKLKALVPESTCVARQKMIHGKKNWRGSSGVILSCSGCKIGEKLWRNDKKMGSSKEKTCATCGEKYPANLNFFDPAPRAADKLTSDCSACRAKVKGLDKPLPLPASKKRRKPSPRQERKLLIINIESSPGLWDALVKKADENLRSPLAQALWILREKLI